MQWCLVKSLVAVSSSWSVQCGNYRGERLLNMCKKGNNWSSSNAKASPSLEQLLFCPPTDVLLIEDTVVRNQLSLMNAKFRCFPPRSPKASYPVHTHSLGCRGKITHTPCALPWNITSASFPWESFHAGTLAMQICSNLLERGCWRRCSQDTAVLSSSH